MEGSMMLLMDLEALQNPLPRAQQQQQQRLKSRLWKLVQQVLTPLRKAKTTLLQLKETMVV
jgi:hypothetical protein